MCREYEFEWNRINLMPKVRKNISEKRLMAIKRDLRARAKKMRLGAERAGAYVFGTLRKIRGNPVTPQVDPPWNYGIYTGGKSVAQRLRRQADIMEMDERLVPSTLTYEDIKDDPKLIAHYKKIMTPMAWRNLVMGNPRRSVRKNPANEALEIISAKQIAQEYAKGGEGQKAKLMFTSKPLTPAQAYLLINEIGDYNSFDSKEVSDFIGKLWGLNPYIRVRVGREYSPCIYIENVTPQEADAIIERAYNVLGADEAHYMAVANRVRLWWD